MTNETKQTAVEQLFIEMLEIQQSGKTLTFDENVELLNKYKEMEIEQMEDAWLDGNTTECDGEGFSANIDFEQYYNEKIGRAHV